MPDHCRRDVRIRPNDRRGQHAASWLPGAAALGFVFAALLDHVRGVAFAPSADGTRAPTRPGGLPHAILGAREGLKLALADQIAAKMATLESAAAHLNDDVLVTNPIDEVKQLAMVSGLHERVRDVMVRNAETVKVHDATRAWPVDTAAVRSAVEEVEAVGEEDVQLEGSASCVDGVGRSTGDFAGGDAAR